MSGRLINLHEDRIMRVIAASAKVIEDPSLLRLRLIRRYDDIAKRVNIHDIYDNAGWYEKFHDIIIEAAHNDSAYNKMYQDRTLVAAAAALSPGMSPDQNVQALITILRKMRSLDEDVKLRAYPNMIQKAKDILVTNDISLLGNAKIKDFYLAITSKGKSNFAPIDRWAAREFEPYDKKIKVGGKMVWKDIDMSMGEYRKFQRRYEIAAGKLGLYPAELQAILWVDKRRTENGSKSHGSR